MNGIELPRSFYNMRGPELSGQISFLKAGFYHIGYTTAVDPTYAREITESQCAYGMGRLLRQHHHEGRLSGVPNGVGGGIWSPQNGLLLLTHYDRDTLGEEAENKRQLQIATGLKVDDKAPLFAVVSRLTSQKGLDLVFKAPSSPPERSGRLALLDAGDPVLQEGFLAIAAEHPGKVGVQIGYHEASSHRIIGSIGVILVLSRFEPCGLTQLYGLKYGTLPLIRCTGGLADTVSDSSLENLVDGLMTGLVFEDGSALSLLRATRRASVLRSRPSLWHYIQRQATNMDFSWQVVTNSYRKLYQRLIWPLESLL